MYIKYYTTRDDGEGGIEFVVIDYTDVKNLSFAPQTDLTGNSLPINEFSVDVITTDEFHTGEVVELYDDMDQLWAHWFVYKAIRLSHEAVRVTARSWLDELDHRQMEEEVFTNTSVSDAIDDCFDGATSYYQISATLRFITLNGYVPNQTARERLKWILLAIGGYVWDIYVNKAYILPVDEIVTLIPMNRTFMRPNIDQSDWVTAIKITSYTFFQASSDDEAAEYNNSYTFPLPWVATENIITLPNTNVPDNTPEKVIKIDGVYLINGNNVSDIAAKLAKYWFNPMTASVDCINNRQYRPGDLVTAYTNPNEYLTGYIQSASFKFGKQARSTLKLIGASIESTSTVSNIVIRKPPNPITYKYSHGEIITYEASENDQGLLDDPAMEVWALSAGGEKLYTIPNSQIAFTPGIAEYNATSVRYCSKYNGEEDTYFENGAIAMVKGPYGNYGIEAITGDGPFFYFGINGILRDPGIVLCSPNPFICRITRGDDVKYQENAIKYTYKNKDIYYFDAPSYIGMASLYAHDYNVVYNLDDLEHEKTYANRRAWAVCHGTHSPGTISSQTVRIRYVRPGDYKILEDYFIINIDEPE